MVEIRIQFKVDVQYYVYGTDKEKKKESHFNLVAMVAIVAKPSLTTK